MVLHELTTNAVKYGALSAPAGRVEVTWRIVQAPSQPPLLWLEWRESGGPPVAEPTRRGFGSRFIEGSVAAELQGAARLHFDAAGTALYHGGAARDRCSGARSRVRLGLSNSARAFVLPTSLCGGLKQTFLANARPEPVFVYLSNETAFICKRNVGH